MTALAKSQGQLQVKHQRAFDKLKAYFSNQPAWLQVFIPVSRSSPKYKKAILAEAPKLGFTVWIPCKTKELTTSGSHLLLSLDELQWGDLRGLPFPVREDTSLTAGSEFVISLKEESSSLWLACFGHVPSWSAARLSDVDKILKQYDEESWVKMPSAACLGHLLKDDTGIVGELEAPIFEGVALMHSQLVTLILCHASQVNNAEQWRKQRCLLRSMLSGHPNAFRVLQLSSVKSSHHLNSYRNMQR